MLLNNIQCPTTTVCNGSLNTRIRSLHISEARTGLFLPYAKFGFTPHHTNYDTAYDRPNKNTKRYRSHPPRLQEGLSIRIWDGHCKRRRVPHLQKLFPTVRVRSTQRNHRAQRSAGTAALSTRENERQAKRNSLKQLPSCYWSTGLTPVDP